MNYDKHTSSAMNYYEELGVSPQATEQEIRKSHRRLVKLMHPDAQPDHNLKMLAETQMRRLNSIVSTLLDPSQRRLYDEQLREAELLEQRGVERRGMLAGIPWWLASAIGAVALTLSAVWLWADHMGRSGIRTHREATIQTARALPPATVQTAPPNPGNTPVGASYTAPAVTQPMPPQSDQPQHGSGISAAVLPDPPSDKPAPADKPALHRAPEVVKPAPAANPPAAPKVEAAKSLPNPVRKTPTPTPALTSKSNPAPEIRKIPGARKATETHLVQTKLSEARTSNPAPPPVEAPAPRKVFAMPPGSLISQVMPKAKTAGTPLPAPPRVSAALSRDSASSLMASPLPSAPANAPDLSASNTKDPLEGEWVYAPKEPERKRAGFYPPEFIDLKLFESGDPGNLKGEYSARYIVTDRPVSSVVSFELASVSRGSRRFLWQSNNGAKGTLNIDPIDERTIRVDWHTTSAIHGPALTSGQATLVRRQ